jgi:hypothetical protein
VRVVLIVIDVVYVSVWMGRIVVSKTVRVVVTELVTSGGVKVSWGVSVTDTVAVRVVVVAKSTVSMSAVLCNA